MIVGLTGGLATGKTTVAKIFEGLGARIIDADSIARDVVREGTRAFEEIVRVFGRGVLGKEGGLDRKRLAHIIYHDEGMRKRLNSITHPLIRERIVNEIKRFKKSKGVIVLDVPLLIEAGLFDLVDVVVVVSLGEEEQIRRLMIRDRIGKDEAILRISTQLPLSKKLEFADYVVHNDGPLDRTRLEVEKIWRDLCKR